MQLRDGTPIHLGDLVMLPVPGGSAKARVVMLGATYAHLDIDPAFLAWIKKTQMLKAGSIVVEWLAANPFANTNSDFAPVGKYMFTALDEFVTLAS